MNKVATEVILSALKEAMESGIKIYTFALYYDHESPAISACIDTVENSKICVKKMNAYNNKYFMRYAAEGDIEQLSMWQANIGRSLSIGNFTLVNSHRTELSSKRGGKKFYSGLLQSLIALQEEVAVQAASRDDLILCCSGPNYEVEYVWAATETSD